MAQTMYRLVPTLTKVVSAVVIDEMRPERLNSIFYFGFRVCLLLYFWASLKHIVHLTLFIS